MLYHLSYPSKKNAILHHNTYLLGPKDLNDNNKKNGDKKDNAKEEKRCSCCGMISQDERLPYSTPIKDLNIGVGVLLFFRNYLFHSFVFLMMFLFYSIFAMITNVISYNDDLSSAPLCVDTYASCGIIKISAASKIFNSTS